MKSNLASKTDSADILAEISTLWSIPLPRTRNLRVYQITNGAQLVTGEGFTALKTGGTYLPFLSNVTILEQFASVVVDMGAVRFVCKGANIMRPGITEHSDFRAGEIVCVTEESQHKFLAVGRAMVDSPEIQSMEKGEVLKNLHYISDRFWEAAKEIRAGME